MNWQRALWRDRADAGAQLATRLTGWRGDPNALVLGLPRGGVVVAAEIATRLQLPLHSWAVRKLAHPSNPELALGAIAAGDVLIWDEPFGRLDTKLRQQLVSEQQWELKRRQQLYNDPPVDALHGRPLIVVDDGVATGLTVRAALQSLRAAQPTRLVLAVPVIDRQVAQALKPAVDDLVALATVDDLWAVGAWYQHFDAVQDQQVISILAAAQLSPYR
jgi:putative phosphoribosyl transferase